MFETPLPGHLMMVTGSCRSTIAMSPPTFKRNCAVMRCSGRKEAAIWRRAFTASSVWRRGSPPRYGARPIFAPIACRFRSSGETRVPSAAHEVAHLVVSDVDELGPWQPAALRVDDGNVRVVAGAGDGRIATSGYPPGAEIEEEIGARFFTTDSVSARLRRLPADGPARRCRPLRGGRFRRTGPRSSPPCPTETRRSPAGCRSREGRPARGHRYPRCR